MKLKLLTILLIFSLILPFFLNYSLIAGAATTTTSSNLFLGVDVSFESISATKQLIDNVSSYTNLFVIGCYGNYNLTRLNIISQYAYDKGLSFIVYTDHTIYPSSQWLADAKSKWGNSFLGIYYYDEAGGKQLDQASHPAVTNASSFNDAATKYVQLLNQWLRTGPHSITRNFAYPTEFPLFTSDYALYWYDYQVGYDTVFAEFTMNYSQQLNLALVRGAATAQDKDWGVMITWKYTLPPYMESGPELYDDMVLAYENGAKYIIVFDGNQNWTENVLEKGQLDAIKQFWEYAKANPRPSNPVSGRTAFVLPADYGYGFRGPQDKIWGLWGPDEITNSICNNVSKFLREYGSNLDIVYPNGTRTVESLGYRDVFYWNDSRLSDDPTPSPSPAQTDSSPSPVSQRGFSPLEMYLSVGTAVILAIMAVAAVFLKFKSNTLTK